MDKHQVLIKMDNIATDIISKIKEYTVEQENMISESKQLLSTIDQDIKTLTDMQLCCEDIVNKEICKPCKPIEKSTLHIYLYIVSNNDLIEIEVEALEEEEEEEIEEKQELSLSSYKEDITIIDSLAIRSTSTDTRDTRTMSDKKNKSIISIDFSEEEKEQEKTLEDLVEETVKHHVKKVEQHTLSFKFNNKNHHKFKVIVHFGKSMTGKSWLAFNQYPEAYSLPYQSNEWIGYTGQDAVIIDGFKGAPWIEKERLMQILQYYPTVIKTGKNSYTNLNANTIVITTSVLPDTWYFMEEPQDILNRIHIFRYFFTDKNSEKNFVEFTNYQDMLDFVENTEEKAE